jgi:glycosyltransferase involved in cell wall biosynthesis
MVEGLKKNSKAAIDQPPLVSIGIPTYNGAKRIGKAINSIFQQAYRNVEVIISDNASTDDTESVCLSYAETDHRIQYHRQDFNCGLSYNFEYVLRQATGKYFIWLSDDDEMLPEILGSYVNFLEQNPEYILVCGEIDYWTGNKLTDRERNLNFESNFPLLRTVSYFTAVKEGALLYGMMRRAPASRIRFKSILGNDWHFVASLAFLGKIKQLDFIGYNKYPGGISRNFRHYARAMGEAPLWGYLPYTKMALDAAKEILYSPIFQAKAWWLRLPAAIASSVLLWCHYNLLILPRIGLGKVLRFLSIKTPNQRKLESLQEQL